MKLPNWDQVSKGINFLLILVFVSSLLSFITFIFIDKTVYLYPVVNDMYAYYDFQNMKTNCSMRNPESLIDCLSKVMPNKDNTIGGTCLDYAAQYCAVINKHKDMKCRIFMLPELNHSIAIISYYRHYCIADWDNVVCTTMTG